MVRKSIVRDELNHTGAHKINNTIGQILLARRMGKRRIIAETVLASMAWQQPRSVPYLGCRALFIWARPMWSAKPQMCFA